MTKQVLEALAPHFCQLGYVVRDREAAEEWFQQILGVPSFFRMDNVTFGPNCSYRGRPADSVANVSLGYLRDTQIELIESVRGPSLYTEFLDQKGPGLHHVAFEVPDFSATVAFLRESGLEMLTGGPVGPGTDFAYFDCEAGGASVIEILGFDENIRGFMEQLRKQSSEAEGSQA